MSVISPGPRPGLPISPYPPLDGIPRMPSLPGGNGAGPFAPGGGTGPYGPVGPSGYGTVPAGPYAIPGPGGAGPFPIPGAPYQPAPMPQPPVISGPGGPWGAFPSNPIPRMPSPDDASFARLRNAYLMLARLGRL